MATTRDSSAAPINRSAEKGTRTDEGSLQQQVSSNTDPESQVASVSSNDVFGNEEGAEIQYKTCSW